MNAQKRNPHDADLFEVRISGPGVEILSSPDRVPVAFVHGTTPAAQKLAQQFAQSSSMRYALERTWQFLNEQGGQLSAEGRTLKRLVGDVYQRATRAAIDSKGGRK